MYLLILCAASIGCGTSAQPNADTDGQVGARKSAPSKKTEVEEAAEKKAAEERAVERAVQARAAEEKLIAQREAAEEERAAQEKAAEEKRAAQEKAAANSSVKMTVEVELRGVLTFTDKAVTISITYQLYRDSFQEDKWVLDFGENKESYSQARGLSGKTVLVKGSAALQYKRTRIGDPRARGSEELYLLDVEQKVAVKSLVTATKE
jgi:hypothetical protein